MREGIGGTPSGTRGVNCGSAMDGIGKSENVQFFGIGSLAQDVRFL